jgi:hypothetical protein
MAGATCGTSGRLGVGGGERKCKQPDKSRAHPSIPLVKYLKASIETGIVNLKEFE